MAISVPDVGPKHVLLGNPTTALGAGMVALGIVRNVTVTPSPSFKTGSTVTGQENHESVFYQGSSVEITVEVPRNVATDVRAFVPHADSDGDYAALGSSVTKQTLCLVHPDDSASTSAASSAKTRWFPSVRLSGQSAEENSANGEGQDDSNFVQLTFTAGYIATDQNGDDVPEAALPDFRGDRLSTHGMTWTLPAPYGAAA